MSSNRFQELMLLCVACIAVPNVMAVPRTTSESPKEEHMASPSSRRGAPAPEPGPFWITAKQQWGWAWKLHWIGLGLAFAFLALKSLWVIIRNPDTSNCFARRNLFYAINWLLVALGTTRSLYLWIDPYESGENIPDCPLWVVRPLFGIAFPCLMSAFCLVHVAFLEVAKIQVGSPKLRDPRFVGSIILVHFAVVIVSDTTTAIKADRTELLIVCQSFFIVWGLLNSVCFMYSGSRVVIKTINIRNRICEMENAEWNQLARIPQLVDLRAPVKDHWCHNQAPAKQPNTPPNDAGKGDPRSTSTVESPVLAHSLAVGSQSMKPMLSTQVPKSPRNSNASLTLTGKERAVQKVASITILTSILSISCCGLQIYSLFGVHGAYTKIAFPEPWPWFAFQTSFRLIELSMAFLLSYCILRPGVSRRKRSLMCVLCLKRTRKIETPRTGIVQINDPAKVDFA